MTDQIQEEHEDLFQLSGNQAEPVAATPPEPNVTPETLPLAPSTPETLPTIPTGTPEAFDRVETGRPPLIFTERAPIPTRNGEQEEAGPVRQDRAKEAEAQKKFNIMTPDQVPDGASLGVLLKLARTNTGYDLDHVKSVTRISLNYIEALEADESNRFPPRVYTFSYTRTLCDLYRLPPELKQRAIDLLNGIFAEKEGVPEEILQRVSRDSVVNQEEERRINRIFTISLASVGVALLIGIWVVVALIIRNHAQEGPAPETKVAAQPVQAASMPALPEKKASAGFDPSQLECLNAEQMCNLYTLELSKIPTVIRK